MPRNPIFTAIHAALAEWLLEQRPHDAAPPGEDVKAYEAHRAIFEAVAARDPDRAERAMREHLEYVARRYTDIVGGRAMTRLRDHRRFPAEAGRAARIPPAGRRQRRAPRCTDEPGCRRFDVVEPQGEPDRVLLYEIYDDEAAFDAH